MSACGGSPSSLDCTSWLPSVLGLRVVSIGGLGNSVLSWWSSSMRFQCFLRMRLIPG